MGQAIATLRQSLSEGDQAVARNVKEQLTFLVNAANSKLDKYQSDLHQMFANVDAVKKTVVPGYRALRWERGYRVGVEQTSIDGGIGEVVNTFFGSGDSNSDNSNPILQGFRKLINTSLNAILGNANAGEQQEQKFFVFVHHNAIIRIDVKIWRYNFEGRGVMANSENVFCYVFCTSVVHHAELNEDELTYLVSEHAGDSAVEAYIDRLISVWAKIQAISGKYEHPRMLPPVKPTPPLPASAPPSGEEESTVPPIVGQPQVNE
ncbi:hypothetical protein GLOTRDRAFT_126400 [Gloeophyllum trabeum ATCC 11539]|uniref:Uncharacterized protein n=1 Tax=Gloeophyllum trabeum (strain ATCC 11539 / FP-39264 / Madison 617) TaxID=670483 RepID=S7QEP9_GLOTA|nr:uncharacterized protein GLOTRDRAFT_126400 [Gloeophyllum trabeum ATCC 11539]EPQ57907.1 hypothetical protein GLOTRDRAFT_126400 [Gloeophyllum trabeum ATCC 11539]